MKARKAFVAAACAFLLVVGSVAATMAYLTSTTEVVQNTFTIGKVNITLDEANVDEYGVAYDVSGLQSDGDGFAVDGEGAVIHDNENRGIPMKDGAAIRVQSNSYKLVPGHTYVKDPTVTVKAGSEPSYVRMLVTIHDIADVKAVLGAGFLPQDFIAGWNGSKWISTKVIDETSVAGAAVYEFRYFETVDARAADVVLDPLFETFTLPGTVTEGVGGIDKLEGLRIDVVAHAIQADNLGTAEKAWDAYDQQKKSA